MKTALITGGSRGIGAETVRVFCRAGWRVLFCYCDSEGQAAALSQETGAISFRADLRRKEDTERLADAALKQLCHVDALIVNAGRAYAGLLTDTEDAAWDDMVALHLSSPFWLLRRILPAMRARGGGAVVFVSSIWGLRGASCEAAYSCVKGGQIALMQALAKEEGPSGLRFNALCPGAIDTDMLSCYTDADKKALADDTPLGRLGTPMDVARAALFLASEDAAFITGQTLSVDGGLL